MRTLIGCFAAAALMILPCGCRKKADSRAILELEGPPGMVIRVAGKTLRSGPFKLRVSPGDYVFAFQAPGYQPLWKKIQVRPGAREKMQIRMELQCGAVLLESRPERARVVFGGKVTGVTPLLLKNLPPGNYSAQLQLPGYAERTVSWTIADGRFLPRILTNLEESYGQLTITSIPSAARVLIGDEFRGNTPFSQDLEEGQIRVTLEAEGYLPRSEWVSVKRGQHNKVSWQLRPRPSSLSFTSTPSGAEVFLNGIKYGVTPCMAENLVPGNYQIRIQRAGFDPWVKDHVLKAGSKEELSAMLESCTGSASLTVRPAGIFVLLDGKPMGRSQADPQRPGETLPMVFKDLAPGKHTVTLSHSRAKPRKKEISFTVRKGEETVCPPCDVWVANCVLYYKSGEVRRGVLYYKNDKFLLFGPVPGAKIQVSRADLSKITELSIHE